MKTKPKLNDLQNVELATPIAGDAIVFNGTTWGNSPVTPDRIVDGTTILSVDTLGTADLSIDGHVVLTTEIDRTTYFAPVGDTIWCQYRSGNYDELNSSSNGVSVTYGHDGSSIPDAYITTWDSISGTILSDMQSTSEYNGGGAFTTIIYNLAPNTFTGDLYVTCAVESPPAAIGILSADVMGRNLSLHGAVAISNGGDSFNTTWFSTAKWVSSDNIIMAYRSDAGLGDTAPWDGAGACVVVSHNATSDTVNWVRRLPIQPYYMWLDSTDAVIFGDIWDGSFFIPAITRISASGTVLSTINIGFQSLYNLSVNAMCAIGNTVYISGNYTDDTFAIMNAASIAAIDCTTGTLLWHRVYLCADWDVAAGGSCSSMIPHPTIPNQLVACVFGYGATTTPNTIAIINAVDGSVVSGATLDIADPVTGYIPNSDIFPSASSSGNNLIISTSYNSGMGQKFIVFAVPDLAPRDFGPVMLGSTTLVGTTPSPVITTTLSAALTPLAVTATPYINQTTAIENAFVNTHSNEPYVSYGPTHTVGVEGNVEISSNIGLAGTYGAQGNVITQTPAGARWMAPAMPDSLWIINPTKNMVANTHPAWVGTAKAPLDPMNTFHASGFYDNVAIGAGALQGGNWISGGEDSFKYNIATGSNALKTLHSGTGNIAIGNGASEDLDINKDYTTSLGHQAGQRKAGSGWVAIGARAQQCSIPTGDERSNSIAIGYAAGGTNGIPDAGIAIGINAGYTFPTSTSASCVAIGENALSTGTEGVGTIAIGGYSQEAASAGSFNTSVGYQTLRSSLSFYPNSGLYTATHCTAVGYTAMYGIAPSNYDNVAFNTAVGFETLYNAGGQYNTAIGTRALKGATTEPGFSKGNFNTALGAHALYDVLGSNNMGQYNNCTGVGYETFVTGNNQVQLGNLNTTTYAFGAVQNRSDIRDKADVRDTVLGLDFINMLRPVDFKWDYRESYIVTTTNEDGTTTTTRVPPDGSKKRGRYHHGLIAQEVKQVLESTGVDFGGYQDHAVGGGQDVLTIGYDELIAPMIKAIQQLTIRVTIQAEMINDLQRIVANHPSS